MSAHRVLSLVFPILLCFGSSLSWANGSADIEELIRNKQWPQAQQKLQMAIQQAAPSSSKPLSPQLRFMHSQILAGQGQVAQAVQELQALIQEFPELPEPHNNLGVLLAAQGKYEAALTALSSALQARPNYKIAHQNLGDLYTAMAQLAYVKAKTLANDRSMLPPPKPAASSTTTTNTRTLR